MLLLVVFLSLPIQKVLCAASSSHELVSQFIIAMDFKQYNIIGSFDKYSYTQMFKKSLVKKVALKKAGKMYSRSATLIFWSANFYEPFSIFLNRRTFGMNSLVFIFNFNKTKQNFLPGAIDQEIFYIDDCPGKSYAFKMTEAYVINNITILKNFNVPISNFSMDKYQAQSKQERSNFHGLQLRAVILPYASFTILNKTESKERDGVHAKTFFPHGTYIHVMQYLCETLNMSVTYVTRLDGIWGDYENNVN